MERDERAFMIRALSADDAKSVAKRLGFSLELTPVQGPALRAWGLNQEMLHEVGELQILAVESGCRLLHVSGPGPWKKVRQAMMAVHRAAPESTVLWWWSSPTAWTAAMVEDDRCGRRRVKKLVLDRAYPDEVGLMQWRALAASRRIDGQTLAGADSWRRHFSQVLDQDGVTREFFEKFSAGLEALIETMEGGPEDLQLRHEIALGTLLRVVFLYFLQARGALDGDRRFVMRCFHACSGDKSFYRNVLRPLFFGALNCPPGLRDAEARELGELPFLNGGLFEPRLAERAHPDLDWDDEVWRTLLEGLFERHRFAVEWSDGGDICRAVDPEMLGKVFEGLMYGDRRKSSGSFYTPRDVVRSMVEGAVGSWLADATGIEQSKVEALIAGRATALSAGQRRRCREELIDFCVLDPAVGTGAFLLEVLRVLRRIDSGLDEAEGVIRTPGERYDRMRRLVHDHLCGVDIQPTAVRLCELRIWLAMLAALPRLPAKKMPPLPNLSHRLCTGNSLLEPLDWLRFQVSGEKASFGRRSSDFDRKSVQRLAVLQRSYTRSHGEEKRELRRALEEATKEVEKKILASRIEVLRRKLEPLRALSDSEDLFGDKGQIDDRQREEKEQIEAEIEALRQAQADLDADRSRQAGFCFDARFAPVMARGGFDVVVTNPPWVRTSRIDRSTRRLYRSRFKSCDHRLWPEASKLGIRTSFGAQVDMAGLFVERSMELLRPAGRLCALVPVKLFRSLHGAGLRKILADHRIEYLEDRSEDDEAMFDATTYPSIVQVRKEEQPPRVPPEVEVSVWREGGPTRFEAPVKKLCVQGGDVREPWMLVEPEIEEIFRKMQRSSVALGSIEAMPICGGVKTGYNAAFLIEKDEARARFSPEVQEKYLRWAVRGRDVQGQEIDRKFRIIWPVDEGGQIETTLPAELEEHFEPFRERLLGRSDYRCGPIWTLFRRHDDVENPGVVWRDMGEKLEAALIGADAIPMNTVYYLPAHSTTAARAVVALFHSEPMRAIAYAIAERARGGWRRHFAWVMRLLPIPKKWLAVWRQSPAELDDSQVIRRAFGLTCGEVEQLRRWRCAPTQEPLREVA